MVHNRQISYTETEAISQERKEVWRVSHPGRIDPEQKFDCSRRAWRRREFDSVPRSVGNLEELSLTEDGRINGVPGAPVAHNG